MAFSVRAPLIGAAVGLAIFALATAAGFLVGHDPVPETVAIRLVPPADAPTEALHPGVVTSVDGNALEIATAAGAQRFDLATETPIEDLSPLGDDSESATGMAVNVGGERTNNGYVLTGVVLIDEATP